MSNAGARWVLAFDASCGSCRTVSHAIGRACDGKLEVLPLENPEVRRLRQQALGPDAPWAPTLLRLRGEEVHAWTGAAMGAHLTGSLGPRSTVRVLRSLGRLHRQQSAPVSTAATTGPVVSRSRFMQLGAGVALAAGMLLTGRIPALADESCAAAAAWVDANRGHLPEGYDEIASRPMVYRRAILAALPPDVQSRLWVEHARRYRVLHPDLTADQAAAVDRVEAMAAMESTFHPDAGAALRPQLADLERTTIRALGHDHAAALLATFGPPEYATLTHPLMPSAVSCTCSYISDYCANSTVCHSNPNDCVHTNSGCGNFYKYDCDGRCFNA